MANNNHERIENLEILHSIASFQIEIQETLKTLVFETKKSKTLRLKLLELYHTHEIEKRIKLKLEIYGIVDSLKEEEPIDIESLFRFKYDPLARPIMERCGLESIATNGFHIERDRLGNPILIELF